MGSFLSRDEFPVEGRTVLITGGSRGLGLAAARQLSSKGARVAIVARDPAVLKEALIQVEASAQSPSQRFFSLTADVTKASECSRVIAEVTAWNDDSPPDIVWCCSGSAHPTLFVDTPVEQLQTMMDSNYFSSAYMAHATLNTWLRPAIDGLTKKSTEAKILPARHIIFTGSFVSLYSFAGFTPYSPSKAAIRSLSDSLSQEMNLYAGAHPNEPRVRIHTVFPATMPTKSLDDENKVKTDVTKALEEGDQILTPDECARHAIAGLERGEELIATSTIIRLVMTTVLGGAIRGGFWTGLANTLLSWVVMIVMVFIRWDMDVKVRSWGKKHGASGMASNDNVKVTLSTASILGNRAQYSPSLQARKPMLQFSPFSVATIVSIRNCGVKLIKNAPKEIQSVAIEMSGLTATLEHLRDIIRTGQSYAKPQFCDAVRHVVENIQLTQQEISKMVGDEGILRRVKWLKAARLLSDIDKHKVTLTLQIAILSAAVLVKSTNDRLSVQEKVENRFKAQAESLILAGQASFENHDEPEPIPDPPQQRAPSPPVRTSKRLPSPVRESEVPGHLRARDLYGMSNDSEDNILFPGSEKEEKAHSALARSVNEPSRPEGHYTIHAIDKEDEENLSSEDEKRYSRRRRRSGFDPLSGGSIALFGPDFHRRGDAATFLYNLVFLNETPVNGASADDSYLTETRNGGKMEERKRHRRLDDSDDSEHNGTSRRERVKFRSPKPQEPEILVNRLLLSWTSLSESEVEKGRADAQPDQRRIFVESESSDSEESLYGPEDKEKTRRNFQRRQTGLGRDMFRREDVRYNTPEFDPRWRGKLRLTRNETASSGFILDPRQHGPSPASEEPSMRYPNGGYGRPYGQGRQAELARPKLQKPDFVVLPRLDSADFETGPMTPKLDLMSVNLGIVRQGDEPIWDCDLFMFEKSYQGKAIMGALIGDKSARNPHGLDLAHTLVKGRSMKLVYIRGNVKETDERAMKEEYVAIGEEWASFEALQQLGLFVKRREEGRVLLDPSTTWLRSMRQRRTFTPTFYSPVSAFRQKHGGGRHSFVTKTDYGEQAPAAPDRRATVEDESEVDILNLPINEEPKKTPEATAEAQSKAAPSTLQPQISITPPSTPEQTSPDYLDTSEVASRVSSGSRLSSSKTSGLGSENTGWQDDGKTPLTPTDSGVGSSIVSGR
ncbi:hypothetical protein IWW34DRAFT_797858 [Fusarium oxysporum f. sp. albedinis]|nr:hypothetical protein IWW34DRAFT_797858 [Fusarium oxysporum f. sp. albedinis]